MTWMGRCYIRNGPHDGRAVLGAQYSSDGKYVLAYTQRGPPVLWTRYGKRQTVLGRTELEVSHTIFSDDGEKILTASVDSVVRLWDLEGRQITQIHIPDNIASAQFSPNGQWIAIEGWRKACTIWTPQGEFVGEISGAENLSFSPNSEWMLSLSGNEAKVWKANGQEMASLEGHSRTIQWAHFSPNSQYILTSSFDSTARIWDINGTLHATLPHEGWVYFGQFSQDNQTVLTHSQDGTARTWNLQGKLLSSMNQHNEMVIQAKFSPDNNWIVSHSIDSTLRIWNHTGQLITDLNLSPTNIRRAAYTNEGQTMIFTLDSSLQFRDYSFQIIRELKGGPNDLDDAYNRSSQESFFIYKDSRNSETQLYDSQGQAIGKIPRIEGMSIPEFSPDRQLILVDSGRSVQVFHTDGQLLSTVRDSVTWLGAAVFSPDSKYILAMVGDGTARVWDIYGLPQRTFRHSGFIINASYSPDGNHVLTSFSDSVMKVGIWDTHGSLLAVIPLVDQQIVRPNFIPGTDLFTLASAQNFHLSNLKGEVLVHLTGKAEGLNFFHVSPGGNHIVVYSDKLNEVELYDVSGSLVSSLDQHQAPIRYARFSPNGEIIYTLSEDQTVKLWNLEGELIADFDRHPQDLLSVSMSPDSKFLMTTSMDQSVKIWPTPQAIYEWLQSPDCPIPSLTKAEKQQYGLK